MPSVAVWGRGGAVRFLTILGMALTLTACDYTEVKHETGYKGKARINPWLAAERFAGQEFDSEVRSLATWTPPTADDAVWFVPAAILSNESFTRKIEAWVIAGGHLVLLVEHASVTDDWLGDPTETKLEPALVKLLARAGLDLKERETASSTVTSEKIKFQGKVYQVNASSGSSVAGKGKKSGVFASIKRGEGRMTVLTDARLFRNRWIGDKDHAALLDALIQVSDEGNIGFLRGSGLSLWGMLGKHLWPVLIGLAGLVLLWLWKNFTRFGPLEATSVSSRLRGYEHHLEALGDFQWRLDRAVGLLAPLRAQIVERGQRSSVRSGRRDDDFFQFLADRADLPRERVFRALAETVPADSAILTRTTADLQRLLQVLH